MRISLLYACLGAMGVSAFTGCDFLRMNRETSAVVTGNAPARKDHPGSAAAEKTDATDIRPANTPVPMAEPGPPVVVAPKEWSTPPIISNTAPKQEIQTVERPADVQPMRLPKGQQVFVGPDAKVVGVPNEQPPASSNTSPNVPSSLVPGNENYIPRRLAGRQDDDWQPPRRVEARASDKETNPGETATRSTITRNNTDGPIIINRTPTDATEAIEPTEATEPVRVPSTWKIVNSTKVYLDYQLENASQVGIAKVEVWLTRDQSRSWQKHSEVAVNKNSVAVQLPGDGLYGLTLVVSDGRKGIAPPRAGDQPDGWIEVDTTNPTMQVEEIRASHDKGQTVIQLAWKARDKNFGEGPVELYHAATPKGPWVLVAKGLPAEGKQTWTPAAGIGAQVYFQWIARDTAGNGTIYAVQEPISVTPPAPPRAVFRGVSTYAERGLDPK